MLLALLACGERRFLGEPVGDHCAEYLPCVAWARDRALRMTARLPYHDPALTAYVQGVADRLAKTNHLAVRPRIVIAEVGSTATAAIGDFIYINRTALAAFDAEDELAAMLAHELVHLDAEHSSQLDVDDDTVWRLDMESTADERAIMLLRSTGYAPEGMLGLLRALARDDGHVDPDHPTSLQRLARTATLLGDGPPVALMRESYRRHVDGLVLGEDPRLVTLADKTLISLAVDVALDEPAGADGSLTLNGSLVERVRGDDITAVLEHRREHQLGGKRVITGVMPDTTQSLHEPSPIDRVLAEELARYATIPAAGKHVILVRGERDLVLQMTGSDLDRWTDLLLRRIRKPTPTERARIKPYRLRYLPARIDGTYAEVAKQTCLGYADFSLLDEPARRIKRGERIKCAVK